MIATVVTAFLAAPAWADYSQVASQLAARKDTDAGLSGTTNFTFNWQSGDVKAVNLGGGGYLQYRLQKHTFLTGIQTTYGTQAGQEFNQTVMAHGLYRYNLANAWSMQAWATLDHREFSGLAARVLTVVGPVYHFSAIEALELDISAGYVLEYIAYSDAAGPLAGDATTHQRAGLSVEGTYELVKGATLTVTAYYVPRLSAPHTDYILYCAGNISVQITQLLSLNQSFQVYYDPSPIAFAAKTNTTSVTSIAVNF